MSRFDRSACIWPLLVFAAESRRVLHYELLGRLVGEPAGSLGPLLEPIQSLCILRSLPPLTCIVVDARSGLPGEGFIAADDLPRAQADTFLFDWLSVPVPSTEDFRNAVQRLPSLGLSLTALMRRNGLTSSA